MIHFNYLVSLRATVVLITCFLGLASCNAITGAGNVPVKTEIYRTAECMPQFPGGEAALYKYIETHIMYPPEAAETRIVGKVIVEFVVEKDGSIGEVKVARSLDRDLADKEAVRLVKSFPKFAPGKINNKPVRVWYTVAVPFNW